MTRSIDVRNLTMKYGHVTALDQVSLLVEQGEFLAILGPSGCGKSTLLSLIAGLHSAVQGEIYVGEQRIDDLPPQKRGIGFVFQNYALFPNMTVWENVAFGLKIRKAGKAVIDNRVRELLDIINLQDQAQKTPNQLSGGQQQRVALARALAPSPDILLLDEPLSALDVKIRQHLRKEIKSVQQKLGITTIIVTHDQEEAFELGDRIAVMDQGKIVQIGCPATIYQTPATEFVACFVGNINRIEGEIRHGEAHAGGLTVPLPDHLRILSDGTAIALLVRPENLLVLTEAAGQVPIAGGTISHTVFLGPLTQLHIRLDQGQMVMATVPKAKAGQENLTAGRRVALQSDSCQIVRADDGTSRRIG